VSICPANTLQQTATHRNTLQHPATHLQRAELLCFKVLLIDTHLLEICVYLPCNTLQHTATHCNTLQHPATPCNTPATRRTAVFQGASYRHTSVGNMCLSALDFFFEAHPELHSDDPKNKKIKK